MDAPEAKDAAAEASAAAAAAAAEADPSSAAAGNPIVRYLTQLDAATLSELYEDSFTSLTLFRSLPPLAKAYVLRLLCVPGAVPAEVVDSWPQRDARSRALHAQALARLGELGIVSAADRPACRLVPAFQRSLQEALANRVPAQPTLKKEKSPPGLAELDRHGTETWETILHHMVGCRYRGQEPQEGVKRLLERAGLMHAGGGGMTREGFRFLFDSTPRQIWRLITGYMTTLEARNMPPAEVLRFLFRISFLKAGGEDYSTEGLTEAQRVLLMELCALGLVWVRKETSSRFYLTRLALNLSSSPSAGLSSRAAAQGHIIVETTFKVYAYTSSSLQASLIGMFCRLECRLPNAIVGRITKKSVRRALKNGVRAREIVHYLEHCAHPQMRRRAGAGGRALPDNVAEQIELWEHERHRFTLSPGWLFTNFASDAEWAEARDWAAAEGILVAAACRRKEGTGQLTGGSASVTAMRSVVLAGTGDESKRKFAAFRKRRKAALS